MVIRSVFDSLFHMPAWTLIIAVLIVLLSATDAFKSDQDWKGRSSKLLIVALSVTLLILQALLNRSQKEAAEEKQREASEQQRQALDQQREDLTRAFEAGTNQVIKATTLQAQRASKQMRIEADSMRKTALGTGDCPTVLAAIYPQGIPTKLAIFNYSKERMYDVAIRTIQFRPRSAKLYTERLLNIPAIAPESTTLMPFDILPDGNVAKITLEINTRATECNGLLLVANSSGDQWQNVDAPMFRKGKFLFNLQSHPDKNYQYIPTSPMP